MERPLLTAVLERTEGNQIRAAALLGKQTGFEMLEPARGPADACLKIEALQPHVVVAEPALLEAAPRDLLRRSPVHPSEYRPCPA